MKDFIADKHRHPSAQIPCIFHLGSDIYTDVLLKFAFTGRNESTDRPRAAIQFGTVWMYLLGQGTNDMMCTSA